jgi:hypothetical protein
MKTKIEKPGRIVLGRLWPTVSALLAQPNRGRGPCAGAMCHMVTTQWRVPHG